jgi:hypothetical protein
LEKLPTIAQTLYKPLTRFTEIYAKPTRDVGGGEGGRVTGARRSRKVEDGGVVDRLMDRVEEVVGQARERVVKRG